MAKTQQERRAALRRKQRQRRRRPDRGRPVVALFASSVIVVGGVFAGLWATGTLTSDEPGESVEVSAAPSSTAAPLVESAVASGETPEPEPTKSPEPTAVPTAAPPVATAVPTSVPAVSSEPTSTIVIGAGSSAPEPVSSTVIGSGASGSAEPVTDAPTSVPVAVPSSDADVPVEAAVSAQAVTGDGSVSVFCSDSLTDGVNRLAVISWSASNQQSGQATATVTLGGAEIAWEALGPGASVSRSITLPDATSVAKVVSVAVNGATIGSAAVPWC